MSRSSISMYSFGGSPLCPSLTDPDLYVKLQWVATLYFTIFVGSTRDTPGCNDFPDFPSGTQDAFGGENLGGPALSRGWGRSRQGYLSHATYPQGTGTCRGTTVCPADGSMAYSVLKMKIMVKTRPRSGSDRSSPARKRTRKMAERDKPAHTTTVTRHTTITHETHAVEPKVEPKVDPVPTGPPVPKTPTIEPWSGS